MQSLLRVYVEFTHGLHSFLLARRLFLLLARPLQGDVRRAEVRVLHRRAHKKARVFGGVHKARVLVGVGVGYGDVGVCSGRHAHGSSLFVNRWMS